MISLVLATGENGELGLDNKLIFDCPTDMKRFIKLTTNKTVIMGRSTYQSLKKPLKNRHNIIVTRDENFKVDEELHNEYSIAIRNDLHSLIEEYKDSEDEVMVIGGSEIYRQAFTHANKIYLTLFHHTRECDCVFPIKVIPAYFDEVERDEREIDGLRFDFIDYVRKENV